MSSLLSLKFLSGRLGCELFTAFHSSDLFYPVCCDSICRNPADAENMFGMQDHAPTTAELVSKVHHFEYLGVGIDRPPVRH